MASLFLTKDNENICVIKQVGHSLVYKLNRTENHSFQFYNSTLDFEMALNQDVPLSDQPYGNLGSAVDLSGRVIGPIREREKIISSRLGGKIVAFQRPVYSLIGNYNNDKLQKFLAGYSSEEKDMSYASISIDCFASGGAGDDLYMNTLFFMNHGYGILTEISAVAGRDIEDCCSPEYYYNTHKIRLGNNTLKRIKGDDVIPEAKIQDWTISTNPEIITPIRMEHDDSPKQIKEFDEIVEQLFLTFLPRSLYA